MVRVNYDEYIERLKKKSSRLYTAWATYKGRAVSSGRPRTPEEDAVLFLLDYKRWQKSLADGTIEKVGPRRYRM